MFTYSRHAYSVKARGKQEVLYDWHDLNLTHVNEKFVKLFLRGAIENKVGSEHENSRSQNGQNIKSFEAKNPVENQENLVNFQSATKGEVNPGEGRFEGRYS